MASIKSRIITLEGGTNTTMADDIAVINARIKELMGITYCTEQEQDTATKLFIKNLRNEIAEQTGQNCDDFSLWHLKAEYSRINNI